MNLGGFLSSRHVAEFINSSSLSRARQGATITPMDPDITYLARTNFRNSDIPFGIRQKDRLSHVYIIGQTGTGKTTLLETMLAQDIDWGRGMALIDPHGDLVERVNAQIPDGERHRLIYIDATDEACRWGYNPLKRVPRNLRPLVASGVLETFQKLYDGRSWGVRMEHIFRNVLLSLLDQPQADFSHIAKILLDRRYRRSAIRHIDNQEVVSFWKDEYEKYPYILRANAIAPIQNKVGAFMANPVVKRLLIGYEKEVSFRRAMDERKVILVNLSRGKIGQDAAHLLGGLIITALGLAAFSRSDIPEAARVPFHIFVDEFQNFTTLSLVNMLSELRKYRVSMTLANQYLHQLEKDIAEAVLGNAGTLISFRTGPSDARLIAAELLSKFQGEDVMRLRNYDIYLKMMIDGSPSKPFSAQTLTPCETARWPAT